LGIAAIEYRKHFGGGFTHCDYKSLQFPLVEPDGRYFGVSLFSRRRSA
jgi:hypothetical protein